MELLNRGLKYNLHVKPKNWLQILAMQAETRIKRLSGKEQNYMRQIVVNNVQILLNKDISGKYKNSINKNV
jgi:hypothetical protein